jgi:hypothetical protein
VSRCLFDLVAPYAGHHNPLRNGWNAKQLHTVAHALGTTDQTIAFVACSLVAEKRTTNMALRYSRSPRNYAFHSAYEGDPLMTFRRVVPAVDWLLAHGYAEGHKGVWQFGKQSIISATSKLMTLAHLVDIDGRQGATLKDEIILRDKAGKSSGFTDTTEIRRMRQEMKTINAHLAQQQYFVGDAEMYVPPAARIFNQTLRRGGRLYHQGTSYQQMRKDKRATIAMLVDGTISPMVERDFESLHMQLAYRRAGKTMPQGDLYEIPGYTRKLTKVATLISLNADGNEVGAISSILNEDEDLALENGLYRHSPSAMRVAVETLVKSIKRKHYRIKDYFGTGVGAQLMRTDSDIAVRILLSMIEQTGRCPLVIHDSFLVPACDADRLDDLMVTALASTGRSPRRNTYQSNPPSLLFHLGKHQYDQHGCFLARPVASAAYVRSHVDLHDHGPDLLHEDLEHR